MSAYDLSILIPARNEMFLAKTIENILANIEGDTEIIAVLDGYWPSPPIPQNERVTIIYNNQSIGQRAATNSACKLSHAKYIMKVDAHCAFDKGFDVKMLDAIRGHDDWTMVPLMKNLHAFDWVCPDGHRRYQGPSGPCKTSLPDGQECGKETVRDILWQAKQSPNSVSYCFDSTPHFQYFGDFAKRPEGQGEITETMSLQGSCWMLTREKYWELNVCDEAFGSWGSQGIEVAVKTWLSGGAVMVNKKTWYAHMFRTQGGDFGFPYPMSGSDQEKAKTYARDIFFNNNWPLQKRPLSWLVEKFWPVKGWTEEDLNKLKSNSFKFSEVPNTKPAESEPTEETVIDLPHTSLVDSPSGVIYTALTVSITTHNESRTRENVMPEGLISAPSKGIIFYTDNQLRIKIAHAVQHNLKRVTEPKKIEVISSSLKPMTFGTNIHLPLEKSYLTMFKQILAALEASTADIIFFAEHDVLYHPSHFDFTPGDKNTFYYNQNVWFLRTTDGHGLHYDVNQLSGLCAFREPLIKHFKERVELTEKAHLELDEKQFQKFIRHMGFEPMTHGRIKWKDQFKLETWKSEYPNIDIRHAGNITGQRWKKDQFRNQKYTQGWTESDTEIPGWGLTADIISKFR